MTQLTFNLGSLDGANGFTMTGSEGSDRATEVSDAGDFNGDGFADIIVDALYGVPAGANNAG